MSLDNAGNLDEGANLQKKTINSVFWSFVSKISTRSLDLIKIIVVARLLSPEDFGLFGIALLTIAIFQVFSQTGFKESIIQNKKDIKSHLNTAWTTLVIRGFVIYGIVFLISPFLAGFFGEPRAELILQTIGIILILQGFQNIAVIFLRKELEFKKKFVLDLGKTLPSFILTISLAFIIKNVWSLVFGILIGEVSMLFISYLIYPYKPRFEFKKDKALELFTFGKWIFLSSILMFLITQGDDIFVGKVLGTSALGIYQLAYTLSNTPVTEVTYVISGVTFPAYSKIQDDFESLKSAFLKVFQSINLLSIPIGLMIISFSYEFTEIFLGEEWNQIVPIIHLLTVLGMTRALGATLGPLYNAKNRPDFPTKTNFLRLLIIIFLIYPLTLKFGLIGTSATIMLSSIVQIIILFIKSRDFIDLKLDDFIKSLIVPMIGGLVISISVLMFKLFFRIDNLIFLVITVIIITSLYVFTVLLFDSILNIKSDVLRMIKEVFINHVFKKKL